MNTKGNKTRNQVQNIDIKVVSNKEFQARMNEIREGLKASTWKQLETTGKFKKEEKLTFISDDMLIVGCDIGSETHYVRAIDVRGRELSKDAFAFSNTEAGFESALRWALELAATSNKTQIVLGLEPTGHYWFCLATWMISHGVSVVQVNPYAVKQTKEIEDNSQLKDDRKDPKLIANLVKDGNYGMPYLPEDVYADLRRLSMLRDQLNEDKTRTYNRLHREMKIFFPEYMDAFGSIDGKFTLELLRTAPFPKDLIELGTEGIREVWHSAKLRGRGYGRAKTIYECAKSSVGLKSGTVGGREAVRWFVNEAIRLEEMLDEIETVLHSKCREIPNAENLLEIRGMGENILSGIMAELGDVSRFDDTNEIQKLSGMNLVASSSGKHKGQTKISKRGRKRLRYWLFQAAKSAVAHAEEFKVLHAYYTTRAVNPLKKKQSLVVIACKLLRIIFAILKNGSKYDPAKMLSDIKHATAADAALAA